VIAASGDDSSGDYCKSSLHFISLESNWPIRKTKQVSNIALS